MIGAYNWRTYSVTSFEVERKNSDSFVAFLEKLLIETYPSQAVILVMDNASYHYSAAVRATLSLFAHRVHVIWLPQYRPDLNAIERFWRHLKQTAWANHLYSSLSNLCDMVQRVLAQQNDVSAPERFMFAKDFR